MICRPHNQPRATQDVDAMVCWMSDEPLPVRGMYAIKHTTRNVRGAGARPRLPHRRQHAAPRRDRRLAVAQRDRPGRLRTTQPLFVDEYRRNRTTGSFILIDEATGATVGAGMIL